MEAIEVRKLASIVFCDVTGSTALGERLDPEVLRRLITRYFEDMRVVLTRHGGTVEKFIGDAVMAVFGIPVVREDDAIRAVRAAYEMRDLVAKIVTPGTDETGALQVRIGVNTGEVIAGDATAGHGFVSGDAVNVAARLEQAAAPGQILIGEATYRLASRVIEADMVPPLELKGKSEPVRAYELVRVKAPNEGERRTSQRLVGRNQEFAALRTAYREVVDGGSSAWLTIVGDPGAGKSALVDNFHATIGDEALVLVGRCLSYGEGITFWPIAELVKEAAGITELSGSREEALAKLEDLIRGAPEAELLLPRLASPLGLVEEVAGAQEVMWAVRALLEHLATHRPVVAVIEDIHWAEPTLLDLIEYLSTFMRDVPVLILTVGRNELLEKRPQWLAQSTRVQVPPLAPDSIIELMKGLLGDDQLPPQVERKVIEAGQGNPLYIQEILKLLIERGLIERSDGRWTAARPLDDLQIPTTIQALLAARLERLPHEERALIQRGSVIGKTFWFGAVSALTTEELRSETGRSLQSLVRKEVLEPQVSELAGEDSFRFGQGLMRDAAYNALPKELRAELHQRVATWLTERAGDRIREYEEVLGYHLEQAALLRRSLGLTEGVDALAKQAAESLARTGRRALAGGDAPAAINLLQRSLALLDPASRLGLEVAFDLSLALTEGGELKRAEEVNEAAIAATSDPTLLTRARLQRSTLSSLTNYESWLHRADDELKGLLEEAVASGDELAQVRALHLLAVYKWDVLKTAEVQELLERALPLARKLQDRVEEGKIEGFLAAAAFWGPMPVDEGVELCNSIRASRPDDRLLQAKCMRSLAGLHAMRGEFDIAREMAATSRSLHLELGQLLSLAHSSQYFGLVELLAGDHGAAIDQLSEGLDALVAMGDEAFSSTQSALLARALQSAGRSDEAFEMTMKSEAAADQVEGGLSKVEWGPTRMRVLAARGQMQDAARLAEQVIETSQSVEDVICAGNCLSAVAELFEAAGQIERAGNFYADALAVYTAKGIQPFAAEVEQKLQALQVPPA